MISIKNPVVIIPSRLKSSRLPNKPLAKIGSKTMIEHVLDRALESEMGPVFLASPDEKILTHVNDFYHHKDEIRTVLTTGNNPTGSDCIYEALLRVDPDSRFDSIVNFQGDLPLVSKDVSTGPLLALKKKDTHIGVAVSKFNDKQEAENPNAIKVVVSWDREEEDVSCFGKALYFSRALVPFNGNEWFHHLGIYAYRRDVLARYVNFPQSLLEKRERLEQLRALENGMTFGVKLVEGLSISVDTFEDLEKARYFI